MPGYDVQIASPGGDKEKFLCKACGLLLQDPVQALSSGELRCKTCTGIPEEELLRNTEYRLDKAVAKELMSLEVFCGCRARGCEWRGQLKSYLQEHFQRCMHCSTKVDDEQEKLKERASKQKVEVMKLKRRHTASWAVLDHLSPKRNGFNSFPSLSAEELMLRGQLRLQLEATTQIKLQLFSWVHGFNGDVTTAPLTTHRKLPKSSPPAGALTFDEHWMKLKSSVLPLAEKNGQLKEKVDCFDSNLRKLTETMRAYAHSDAFGHEAQCTKGYDARADHFTMLPEKPLNGSSMQCRWLISDIAQKLTYARRNPEKPLISPTWCTGNCGYTMRAYLFLNGYGSALGENISTFMSVVRGLHDDFLPWPVGGYFTHVILDHEKNTRPKLKKLSSDPRYPFQKPCSQEEGCINASGCENFALIDMLFDKRYVKDDTMCLEFKFEPVKRMDFEE